MKIIREKSTKTIIEYQRSFIWKDDPHSGYGFDCDEQGNLLGELAPEAVENFNKCVNGEYDVIDEGIRKYLRRITEYKAGICEVCGNEVELRGFTNTCDHCDADYNFEGTKLAPREQWGEETGETVEEILSVDYR